jgi:type I restriction enzyme S subunit
MLETNRIPVSVLGQLFDGPHATPVRRTDGPYFLNISSLKAGRLDLSESDHVSHEDFVKWTRRVAPRHGDLLFSYETRLGEAALMPEGIEACLGRRMALLRPDRSVVNPRFLLYFYLSPYFQELIARNAIHGATVSRIGLASMPRWEVEIPSNLGEQKAIAEVLGVLDDKIAANDRIARLTDDLLMATFARIRAAAPMGQLSDIAQVNITTTRPRHGNKLRYLDISAVSVGSYEMPDLIDWEDAPGRARRVVRDGDTVWSTVRPNRRSHALILDKSEQLIGSTGLAVISPFPGRVAGAYESSRTDAFVKYLESVAEGSAYPAVRGERFLEAPVPKLAPEVWDQFEGLALPMRRRLDAAIRENRALAATRDELLPLLMSGRIRVRDAEKVVEEVA